MRPRHFAAVCCLLLTSCLCAQQAVLRNTGFEAVAKDVPADWTCPPYWSGELTSVADPALVHGGKRAAQLKAVTKDGRTWGRILNVTLPAQVGLDCRFSVFARGTGNLKLGVINYVPEEPGKNPYQYVWQEQATALTEQWQQIAFTFTPASYAVIRVAPVIEVEGPDAVAVLDDVDLQVVRQAEGQIVASPYVMARTGATITADWRVERAGQPTALPVLVVTRTAAGTTTAENRSDDQGRLHLTLKAPDAPDLVRVDVIQRDLGAVATVYLDTVSEAVYNEFAAAAQAVKVGPAPQHWLFFGDSLTDFSRGFNYVDQMMFWVNRAGAGAVTYRNAGVGGDYITRSLDRLNGKAGTYRLEMYNNLVEPKPTRCFMMLGHNDSKLTSGSGFTEPVVKPEDYKTQFIEFIGKVKEQCGAPFTLLSPTSSVYEITKANADKAVAAGRGASLFGKPEVMAQFAELTQQVATATGSGYVDVLTPTRDFPSKPTLFTADGVHLSLDGNHLLALALLKHLAK
jgi:lysophospholipase L1-like esterase